MKLNRDLTQRIEKLIKDIQKDFAAWDKKSKNRVFGRTKNFNDSLRYEVVGNKYVRIWREHKNSNQTTNSVWGFVVVTENDKEFPQGEILKAASMKTPTRSGGRGNLFTGYNIEWTGPRRV